MADLIARVCDEIEPKRLRRNAELRRVMRRINSGEELSEEDWAAVGRDYLELLTALPDLTIRLRERHDLALETGSRMHVESILASAGDSRHHAELFQQFLTTAGVNADILRDLPAGPEVAALTDGLASLFADEESSIARALGALTALELLSIEAVRNLGWVADYGSGSRRVNVEYFDVRLSATAAMRVTMRDMARVFEASPTSADAFLYGAESVATLFQEFWTTLWAPVFSPHRRRATIFLSWSGVAAQRAALVFRDVLTHELRLSGTSYFFFSETDIASGANWEQVIKDVARSALAGIIVLTPESATSPWVNFEAGLLSVSGTTGRTGDTERFPLHVLVVSSNPRGLLEQHPLQSLQMVTSQQPRALVEAVWTLLADHHAAVDPPTSKQLDAVADLLKERLKPWEFEADKALVRRPSARARWTEYLLSLGTPRLNVPSPDPVNHLPPDLRDAEDMLQIMEALIVSYLGGQIDHGDRVYLAVQVDDDILLRANRGRFVYRILFVTGGAFDELDWHANALVGPRSTIHQAYLSKKVQLAKRFDAHNAPVVGEAQVACAPIRLDSRVVAVLGISSNEDARTLRIENMLSRFSQMLEFYLTIVAARVRRGDLVLKPAPDATTARGPFTDDDISHTIWKVLANYRLNELFRSEDDRILNTDLLIRNSFR